MSDTRLHGRWLVIARIGWIAFFTAAMLALIAATPIRWAQLVHPSAVVQAYLGTLGWPLMAYSIYSMISELVFTGVFLVVGVIIFVRRPDDRMALFTSVMLIAFGVGNQTITPTVSALLIYPFGEFLFACAGFAAWATFTQFPFLFPNGRYVPAWTRVPALTWFLLCIPWNFMVGSPYDPTTWPSVLFIPLGLFLYGSFLVCQVYRYRRVSTPLERQQTKWVVYAVGLVVVSYLVLSLLAAAYDNFEVLFFLSPLRGEPPTLQGFVLLVGLRLMFRLGFLFLPFAFAFSILRYRLWDIDVIIRRTLVYTLLTIALALVFFGGVALLQGVFGALSGTENSPVAIVLSTLAIAALFNPLRKQVQVYIDRRFYRKKYNAEQALARFAAKAREETDVDQLSAELLAVVQETMQPNQVSVWLLKRER
jgi:hypothetical protein